MKKILMSVALFISAIFAADVEVSDIYIKQTPPKTKNTAIFLKIQNNSDKDVALVDVESDLSDNVELHTNLSEGKKMKMIKVPEITIKAKSSIELKPGGDHIMLFDIKQPVTKDSKVSLTLNFSNGETLNFTDIGSKEVAKQHSHK